MEIGALVFPITYFRRPWPKLCIHSLTISFPRHQSHQGVIIGHNVAIVFLVAVSGVAVRGPQGVVLLEIVGTMELEAAVFEVIITVFLLKISFLFDLY